ncbi:MAG TPA: hypothetical protein VGK73_35420 [Polyangiaceae bacterium]
MKGTHADGIVADRARVAKFVVALFVSCAGCSPAGDATPELRPSAVARAPPASGTRSPDDAWLVALGTGSEQTAKVCARGQRDRVTSALCGDAPSMGGLAELYAALGLADPEERDVAATTHSLGLAARAVSAANPRVFVFRADGTPLPWERFAVAAFSRGEQLVELVGLDPSTLDYNFYLLRFEQACNVTGCTPEELLTERAESEWSGWTLYAESDLEDTPFDCVSCHQPFGPDTPKQLLMRQTASPWLHWGDFRGAYESRLCPETQWPAPGPWIPGEGLELLLELEGAEGRYGAIPVRELADAPSGERFALFLTDAENTLRSSRVPADYPYAQLDFASTEALCERLATGSSPTWERQRAESLARGLPVPYFAEDLLDPARRLELEEDRDGFLAEHETEAALDVAMTLLGPEVATAVGFIPRETDTAAEILRQLCVRCHASSTPSHLLRARFDAAQLESIEPNVACEVRRRIALPQTAPDRMPPLRSGELPAWAVERVLEYLDERGLTESRCP